MMVPGSLVRLAIHPEGWLAGARALFAAGIIAAVGATSLAAGVHVGTGFLIASGVLLIGAALAIGTFLAYAAAGPRRRRMSTEPAFPNPEPRGDEGMIALVTSLINGRFDDLNDRLDRDKADHQKLHEDESLRNERHWIDQSDFCKAHMGPLETDLKARTDAGIRMNARIAPIRILWNWANAHPTSVAVMVGFALAAATYVGWQRP
jgi:hypothetical protein